MKIFRKNIFTAASPNTTLNDAWLAFKILIKPWTWFDEVDTKKFETAFADYTGLKNVVLIDSWRSGFYMVLKTLGLKEGDEVILPSFTCVVVANAALWSGATPIYLDSSKVDFNANYLDLPRLISPKTKAILIQHTFGKFVDVKVIKALLKTLKREDIYLIEDFAHVIHRDMKLEGDIGIFTFGIEKVISSVRGGCIALKDEVLKAKLSKEVSKLPSFPKLQVFKSLLNPIFWAFAIPLHSVGFGRFSIGALVRGPWRKLGFLGIMVDELENKAEKPKWFPAKMNPALARLGLNQLNKLDKLNEHRLCISQIYTKYLSKWSDEEEVKNLDYKSSKHFKRVYLRYPLLLKSQGDFNLAWNTARALGITPGNWFQKPLYGASVDSGTYKKLYFDPSLTPETLKKCGLTLNLPTSINISKARAKELAIKLKGILTKL